MTGGGETLLVVGDVVDVVAAGVLLGVGREEDGEDPLYKSIYC